MERRQFSRREFVRASSSAMLAPLAGCRLWGNSVGQACPAWRPGELDIHFIHTGTGEQTFFRFPDGTTMLLDCGFVYNRKADYVAAVPAKPDGTQTGGDWVTRYLQRVTDGREIDYVMISHWHDDHIRGIPVVGSTFRFRHYFDHQYPRVGQYRHDADKGGFDLLRQWFFDACAGGMQVEPFEVGALNQIRLRRDAAAYPTFEIRNVAANGVVWDGRDGVRDCAAEHVRATGAKDIEENMLSSAIRIRYGNFSYFTGGDIEKSFVGADGVRYNYEELVGKAAGPVSVCKTNHHAYLTAMSPEFVRAVRAQAYVSSVWSPNQTNVKTLTAMSAGSTASGGVYYGHLPEKARREFAERGLLESVAPSQGHAVVKVAPGGETFRIFVLSAEDESMTVLDEREFVA